MNWTTGKVEQPTKPLSVDTQTALGHYGSQDAITFAWKDAQAALENAKAIEARLRRVVVELYFPTVAEGTNRAALPGGFELKCQQPYSYKLDNKEGKTERALDAIAEISQQAGFVADRLVSWLPELSIREFRSLNTDNPAAQTPEQKAIAAILSGVLTIKPGMPQLSIEPAKAK